MLKAERREGRARAARGRQPQHGKAGIALRLAAQAARDRATLAALARRARGPSPSGGPGGAG